MSNLILQDVRVIFTNFSGKPGRFNKEGEREFSAVIDDLDLAEQLMDEGWNLRPLKNDEGEVDAYSLGIKINYDSRRPPRITRVRNNEPSLLDEDSVSILDYESIESADLSINPYRWSVNGRTGVKGYLTTGYFVVKYDELDAIWEERLKRCIDGKCDDLAGFFDEDE